MNMHAPYLKVQSALCTKLNVVKKCSNQIFIIVHQMISGIISTPRMEKNEFLMIAAIFRIAQLIARIFRIASI